MSKKTTSLQTIGLVISMSLLANPTHAWEIRPHLDMLAPSAAAVQITQNDEQVESSRDIGLSWQFGTEASLPVELFPLRYGMGLGIRAEQKNGNTSLAPWSIPLWMTLVFGQREEGAWSSPYLAARCGWIIPISSSGTWWNKPSNLLAEVGIGTITKHGIAAEMSYDYVSLLKSIPGDKTGSRITCGRLAFSLSWGILWGTDHPYNPQSGPRELDDESQMSNED